MKKNNKIKFSKLEGAGNDFIIVDLRSKQRILKRNRKNLVRAICDRNFGVGADGLIFLEKTNNRNSHFKWDFYNKDGSHAEMCLNASRCVIRYALNKDKRQEIVFESIVGLVIGKKLGKNIMAELPLKRGKIEILSLKAKNNTIEGYAVNSGVPHFVVHKDFKNLQALKEVSSNLRFHKHFKKPGSNVTYWNGKGSSVKAVTFERGVEDFTLACGTGAVAVGMVFDDVYKKNPIDVQMPGGKIEVKIKEKSAIINGPAELICEGEFYV